MLNTFELTDQIDMVNRRLEWMAASALVSATVTVAGKVMKLKWLTLAAQLIDGHIKWQ